MSFNVQMGAYFLIILSKQEACGTRIQQDLLFNLKIEMAGLEAILVQIVEQRPSINE